MKKRKTPNHVLVGLATALIIIACTVGLMLSKDFVGWFYHTAKAGYITHIQIHHTYSADTWHGFAGIAMLDYDNPLMEWNETVEGGNTTVKDLNFNCFGKTGFDVYASPVPLDQIDVDTIQAATPADIDAYMGVDASERVSATNTFNETFTIKLGGDFITGPGMRTKCTCANNKFHQVALKDGNGSLIFVSNASLAMPGFDGELYNYQMMVPMPANQSSVTYHFFPDPVSDILGECVEWDYNLISGYVNDSDTGLPLEGVIVYIGNSTTTTNASGIYSMLAQSGTQFVLGFKAGYNDHINYTTVSSNGTNEYNFTMIPLLNGSSEFKYGFISGIVTDRNGTPMENVTVMSGVFSNISASDGSYSIISIEGNGTTVLATKTGYLTNISYVNVTALQTTAHDIVMTEQPVVFGPNGTVYGKVLNFDTNQPIENATIYAGGWSTNSNSTGDYRMSLPSTDTLYIIAVKDFYDPAIGILSGNYSITPDSEIEYDIYLNESELVELLIAGDSGQAEYDQPPGIEATSNDTGEVEKVEAAELAEGLLITDDEKITAYITMKEINAHIKQDSFIEQPLAFYNFGEDPLSLEFAVKGEVTSILHLSQDSLSVDPKVTDDIQMTMTGSQPAGVYKGSVEINGDIQAILPVEIKITKGGRIPINTLMMEMEVLRKTVVRGNQVKYQLDLVNLLTDREYDVNLKFYLASINGTMLTNVTENTVSLKTFTSIVGMFIVPEDFKPGDYVVRAQADYLGLTSTTDALFSVRDPIYAYDLFGIVPVWMLATLLALLSVSLFTAQEIKRRAEAKKRFHAKVEYDELPQEGDRSLFVGNIAETSRKTYFDMDRLTVHSIVAGSTGGGKSISAQDIIEECLLKGTAVAVFDPTAQWSGMLRKLEDKKFLEFYAKFGMDPKKDPRGFNGNIKAVKNGREIIDIFKYLKPGEIQIFTTNTLDPKDYDVFVASMIQQIFHSKLDEFRGLKYLLVFDEIHRILPKFGGSGAGFTQIERGCREFRKWGIGIVLISQVLSDFVGEIKANINTLVQMKTRDEGDLARIRMQYGDEYIQSLVKSPVGSGMVQNSSWNRGKPYYVTFRPILHSVVRLTDEELDKYNKYNEIVEQLEYEFEQLEELKQDVFDLKLELKLSKDKIKSGNFNMVQIYLDGLMPRVEKLWEKLGKKPKKLEIKLLDTSAMEEDLKKAKAEKKEAEAKEKADGGQPADAASETPPESSQEPSTPAAPSSARDAASDAAPHAAPAVAPATVQENTPVAQNPTAQFTSLIKSATQAINAKDKAKATQSYNQARALYAKLPQQQKPLAYKHITNINKQISALK